MIQERLPQNVESVPRQMEIVAQTTSLEEYILFHDSHFDKEDTIWMDKMKGEKPESDRINPQEYYKWLAYVGMLGNQLGFPKLEGHLKYLYNPTHPKRPITSPRHQLALASYAGNINEQTYPYKEYVARLARILFPDSDFHFGAWGVRYESTKGHIDPPWRSDEKLVDQAVKRFEVNRQIALQNREVNRALAELGFYPEDAEQMGDLEFVRKVYPKVERIVNGHVDTYNLFIEPLKRPFHIFYSLAKEY